MRKLLCILVLATITFSEAFCSEISSRQAKDHIGENATVCGTVVSAHFARTSRGQPTFLNLDEAYPNQVFTIVIWGSDRPKFGDVEGKYSNRSVCVSGLIKAYQGVPEVIASEPTQIRVR